MRHEGRTALVTGGASGIGAATARRLAAEGARVAVCDVNFERAREVAAEIGAEAFAMDVTDAASVGEAVAKVTDALGTPMVLVNNAGTDEFGFFQNTDEALWLRVLDVNRIVNVASEAGRVGSSGSAAYSAAKGGVIGFTKAIAREAGRYGVLCNAVAPGPIDTPLLNSAPQQLGDLGRKVIDVMVGSTVLRRMGEPDEVAAMIAFLCSDDASYVTGQALGVSGGLAMI